MIQIKLKQNKKKGKKKKKKIQNSTKIEFEVEAGWCYPEFGHPWTWWNDEYLNWRHLG